VITISDNQHSSEITVTASQLDKSTVGSTDDSDDSQKHSNSTDEQRTDVGRREIKIQTTNGVTKSSSPPQSSGIKLRDSRH